MSLHAEIHGKLSPDIPEGSRREDVLTSSVFGTLFTANAQSLLLDWFRTARDLEGASLVLSERGGYLRYWFWPRLAYAEPDVVVFIGKTLFVVEAKYLSAKSSRGMSEREADSFGDDDETADVVERKTKDQLADQWLSLSKEHISYYPPDIATAIRESNRHILIYVVRAPHQASTLRDVSESLQVAPDAEIVVVSWSGLHQLLCTELQHASNHVPWKKDLVRLLERRGLNSFRGFVFGPSKHHLPQIERLAVRKHFRSPSRGAMFRLGQAEPYPPMTSIRVLAGSKWFRRQSVAEQWKAPWPTLLMDKQLLTLLKTFSDSPGDTSWMKND